LIPTSTKLRGRHSLKSWGYRLGVLKGELHEEAGWETFTEEMADYCMQDVIVTSLLKKYFVDLEYSEEAMDLEHKFATVMQRQMLMVLGL
jgi:DNA polymerase I